MALNGVNIVYATTGMEYIFSKVSTLILRNRWMILPFAIDVGVSSVGFQSSRSG
jgi:hypothetical protein